MEGGDEDRRRREKRIIAVLCKCQHGFAKGYNIKTDRVLAKK
jgi:hypothetical protein